MPLCKIPYLLITGEVSVSRQSWRPLVYWSLGVLLMLSEDEVLRKQIFQMPLEDPLKWLNLQESSQAPANVGDLVLRVAVLLIKVNLTGTGQLLRDELLHDILAAVMTNLMESVITVDPVTCELLFDDILGFLLQNSLDDVLKGLLIGIGNVLLNHPKSNARLVYRMDESFEELVQRLGDDREDRFIHGLLQRMHAFLSHRSVQVTCLASTHSPTEIIGLYTSVLQNFPAVGIRRDHRGIIKAAGVRCLCRSRGRIE